MLAQLRLCVPFPLRTSVRFISSVSNWAIETVDLALRIDQRTQRGLLREAFLFLPRLTIMAHLRRCPSSALLAAYFPVRLSRPRSDALHLGHSCQPLIKNSPSAALSAAGPHVG